MGGVAVAGTIGDAPKDNPPSPAAPFVAAAGVGEAVEPSPTFPNIETRSSNGLLDVPDSRFAAAGVAARAAVAAMPDGCCSSDVGSSKLSRFSAC